MGMFRQVCGMAFALLLSACGQPEAMSILRPDVSPSETELPIESVVLLDKPLTLANGTGRQHITSFGNWTTHCTMRRPAGSKVSAECSIVPWNGKMLQGQQPNPLFAMAIVKVKKGTPHELMLMTTKRLDGDDVSYQCGERKFSEVSRPGPVVPIPAADAVNLARIMKTQGCEIRYTEASSGKLVSAVQLAHGFAEAETYAKRYVVSPK